MNSTSSFYNLDPEKVLQAADSQGFLTTGEFSQLNSYENRVFDIRLENPIQDVTNVIAKFYRPQRWSEASILEEHQFLLDLQAEGIPAVAPLTLKSGKTLVEDYGMYVAFFPKVRGRMPQEFVDRELQQVGRLMAEVHNIGARRRAVHRPVLDTSYYGGWPTLDFLQSWIAPEIRNRYNDAAEKILNKLDEILDHREFLRIHGDCHKGNLLHNGGQFFLVDFDDFCTGPVIQDFWMLLSGEGEEGEREREEIIEGYEELRQFPYHQWDWVPWLRGLRIISYAGWIAKRWEDPSFPRLFPEFNTYRYWAEEVEALEKIAWAVR
ncbi:MAG: serine/threonine protein kinase [Bdellovibrionaceae bacterium]|nr:serine/threonine protein kinase [Pseudobdellovibrionaceae bacterium]